jgi:hypothetical protein
MMTVPTRVLMQDLIDKTDHVIAVTSTLKGLSLEVLKKRPSEGQWSLGELISHLVLYGDYYIGHVKESLIPSNLWKTHDTIYKSTWLGNYFANIMLPKDNGSFKKMKSPANKRPSFLPFDMNVLDSFFNQQNEIKEILIKADKYDVNRAKVSISILPIIKINLGDTLRFCVNHNLRHCVQLQKIKKELNID